LYAPYPIHRYLSKLQNEANGYVVARAANCELGTIKPGMVFEDGYADSPEFSFLPRAIVVPALAGYTQPSTTTEQMVQHRDAAASCYDGFILLAPVEGVLLWNFY